METFRSIAIVIVAFKTVNQRSSFSALVVVFAVAGAGAVVTGWLRGVRLLQLNAASMPVFGLLPRSVPRLAVINSKN